MPCTSYILCNKKGFAQLGWSSRPEESGRETGKALTIGLRSILWFFYPAVYCGKYVFLEHGDPETLCATPPRTIGMLSVPEDH